MGDSKPSQSQLSEEFMAKFNKTKEELAHQINELAAGPKLNDGLTAISTDIQKLSKTLHDAAMFLPSYSIKIRQNEIRELEKQLKEKENEIIPKKRFGFKSKAPPIPSTNNEVINTPAADQSEKAVSHASMLSKGDNFFTIENIKQTTVRYTEDQLNGNDVLVKDSTDAVIILEGGPSTLRLANLRNCKLLCGPVRTSVFVDNVQESVLFLCCQQLRTHSSENVDFYLRVSSRAIIEDCKKIRFGPYSWNSEKSEALHTRAEIASTLERYDAVDDFNWLSSTPSPNWCLIPSDEISEFTFG
ncbi:Tubulin-specific chaperone C [Orchesella cincta]|uniref:Tubulin-specific chaperone C n=1 Tax=Orchesella cincta TaxID=48709 RepID=A0A1D2N350_ORCCI|nr:Tubulin-specific chaperone C [Orchesella cincta]